MEPSSSSSLSFDVPPATSSPYTIKNRISLLLSKIEWSTKKCYREREDDLKARKDRLQNYFALKLALIPGINEAYYDIAKEEIPEEKNENIENIDPEERSRREKDPQTKNKSGRRKASSRKNKNTPEKRIAGNFAGRPSILTRSATRAMRITKTSPIASTSAACNVASDVPSGSRTPLRRCDNYKIAAVTPRPNISASPITIMRRQNPGEIAISLTGSPLMLGGQSLPTELPHINIPLQDGRVMAVIGDDDRPLEDFSGLTDPDTMLRLKRLYKFLGKAVSFQQDE